MGPDAVGMQSPRFPEMHRGHVSGTTKRLGRHCRLQVWWAAWGRRSGEPVGAKERRSVAAGAAQLRVEVLWGWC